jgi:molybdopterin-guanine dinucleotide biosynthesis protein A
LAANPAEQITGLILAGGEGRRMGGADKGLVMLQGRPLITHVIERLQPQVSTLLISANRNLDAYRGLGYPVLPDAQDDFQGPLAGLQAGLLACRTEWMLSCPCDCPALPLDLARRLLAVVQSGGPLAIACTAGKTQPAFQLIHRSLLPILSSHFASGGRKLMDWCRSQHAIAVDFPDSAAFRNLNDPENLRAFEQSEHGDV